MKTFRYRHTDGDVRIMSMPDVATLARKPFVVEVLGEVERMPGRGERFDAKGEIVALPAPADPWKEIEGLKATVAVLQADVAELKGK